MPEVAYLLNLAYLALLAACGPWLLFAALFRGKYREGYAAKLWGRVPRRPGRRRCLWLHAVSVGEVNLLEPLLARIQRDFPGWECVISTTTKTGFDLATRKYAPHVVFYCPLDFIWAVAAALRRVRPDLLVLAELELWPNLIAAARRQGAQVAIVNGRLSSRSARGYARIGWLVRRVLRQLDLVAVQSEAYRQRFVQLGARPEAVTVTGSLKFDGARSDRRNPLTQGLARLAHIGGEDVVFLAGSTQHPEEALALQAFARLRERHPRLRLILAPRHPHRCGEVAQLLDRSGLAWQRRSELTAGASDPQARILLIDTIGELAAWWGAAQVAYVGGSLGKRGGQNMIEPAAYGAAVSFGPHTHNFRDVVHMLLERQAAVVVRDGDELAEFVGRCLDQPQWAAALGSRAAQLVGEQLGAAERTLQLLAGLLEPSARRPRRKSA